MSLDALRAHLRGLPPARVVYTDLDGTLLGADGSLLTGPDGRPSLAAAAALCDAAGGARLVVVDEAANLDSEHTRAFLSGRDVLVPVSGAALTEDWFAVALEAAGALPVAGGYAAMAVAVWCVSLIAGLLWSTTVVGGAQD